MAVWAWYVPSSGQPGLGDMIHVPDLLRGYWQEFDRQTIGLGAPAHTARQHGWAGVTSGCTLESFKPVWLGLAHFSVGYILTYGAFLIASTSRGSRLTPSLPPNLEGRTSNHPPGYCWGFYWERLPACLPNLSVARLSCWLPRSRVQPLCVMATVFSAWALRALLALRAGCAPWAANPRIFNDVLICFAPVPEVGCSL